MVARDANAHPKLMGIVLQPGEIQEAKGLELGEGEAEGEAGLRLTVQMRLSQYSPHMFA